MLHARRTWGVAVCEDLDELARKMSEQTWTLCTAFRTAGGTVWANDSTCEDGAQEYAVLRPTSEGYWRQVETITVSWCSQQKLRGYLGLADEGAFDRECLALIADERIESPHETCDLCA